MTKEKKKHLHFFLQIIAILLVGAMLSVGVHFYIQDKNIQRYTITFANANGNIIEEKTVKEGYDVMPSKLEAEGYVFRGWDSVLNNVYSDIETHPIVYKIVEPNLFYFDSIYIQEGKAFKLKLMLGGDVNISGGNLILKYDDNVFNYESYTGDKITEISETTPGELNITFNSEEVLNGTCVLAELKFYAEKKDVVSSEMILSAKGEEMFLLSNGEKHIADCATINNNIYFIQEVG